MLNWMHKGVYSNAVIMRTVTNKMAAIDLFYESESPSCGNSKLAK